MRGCKPASRLRRRPDVFLDRILLAHDGHRSGWFVLEFYMAIYFAIWGWFCGLLRPRAGKSESASQANGSRCLLEPEAQRGRHNRHDKIDQQPATRFHPRGGVDHA